MATHPYISGPGSVTQMIGFLRKTFPATVSSDTVKKYQLAPKNESYVINALQFLGIIDEEGRRIDKGHEVLLLPSGQFETAFGQLVREAYADLFELRADDAWTLSKSDLTAYFRTSDKTSEVIGGRQAGLFQALSALAGYDQPIPNAKPRPSTSASASKNSKAKSVGPKQQDTLAERINIPTPHHSPSKKDMALTVRIEINLPAEGSQETYDNIFKSIKANLIDA